LSELATSDKDVLAVLDHAFALYPSAHWLKAVVVMRDGKVVAERYAAGYGPDTRVLGWSVTKSVINALTGILVREGRLTLEQPAPVGEWSNPTDPRHTITVDQLLRMRSGLDIAEKHGPFDPASRMLFLEYDMGAFAAHARLRAPPGTTFSYSSGNYLVLSRIIREAVGGNVRSVLEFARSELFEPLGMQSTTFDFDATGTPIGSTYMYATARDWARFGTLYLDDGIVNGKHILPLGWVRYSTASLPDSGYGAGFEFSSKHNSELGVPPDTFFAEGFLGQELAIIPSERLVVARFGVIDDNWGDLNPLVPAIISALHKKAN
jgi:CubicO group peptidase (beta-lactamase class C family)